MEYIGILVIVAVIAFWVIATKNNIRKTEIKIQEAESGIDVALTKRFDTLSKMYSLVKKYMAHEQDTLEKVIKLRQGISPNSNIADKKVLENELDNLQKSMNVIVEQYPELKSSETVQELQHAVLDVEEHLQASRRAYNSNVSHYNQLLVVFPSSIIANNMGAKRKDFFEARDEAKQDVKFD